MYCNKPIFALIGAVSGTKHDPTGPVSSTGHESASSLPPEVLFWIWILVSTSVFLFAVWALFSNLDGTFLHLPSRGRPAVPRRVCACGYQPGADEEDCPDCGLKLPPRVAEHLQKYRGPGRRARPFNDA